MTGVQTCALPIFPTSTIGRSIRRVNAAILSGDSSSSIAAPAIDRLTGSARLRPRFEKRVRVTVVVRKSWMIAGVGLAALCLLLGWAWRDGGLRPVSALSEPAKLPQVGQ